MKKVGIIGTRGKVSKAFGMGTDQLLHSVGANTGNLVFQYSVYNTISEDRIVIGVDIPWDVNQVKENCRVIVVPAANFIREGADFTSMTNFLEQVDLPLVVVGLGVQAKDYNKKIFDLHSSTLRLLELFKERCKTIGLRGEYSAEILSSMGVNNIEVIGCPSNFLNPDVGLPDKIIKKASSDVEVISATGDEPWPSNSLKRDAERKLLTLVQEFSGTYVIQSVQPFVKVLRDRNIYQKSEEEEEERLFDSLREALMPHLSTREFRRFARSRFRIYVDVDQWLEEASRFDFSVGLRLHGNMVPFQAGTPAVWVAHDARTQELSEVMSLPHVSVSDFLNINHIQELKEVALEYLPLYRNKRTILLERYVRIFEENEIQQAHRLSEFKSSVLA